MTRQAIIERMSPKRAKELKPDELRSIRGRFSTHLGQLMQAANVTKEQLATGADLKEPAIRKLVNN